MKKVAATGSFKLENQNPFCKTQPSWFSNQLEGPLPYHNFFQCAYCLFYWL